MQKSPKQLGCGTDLICPRKCQRTKCAAPLPKMPTPTWTLSAPPLSVCRASNIFLWCHGVSNREFNQGAAGWLFLAARDLWSFTNSLQQSLGSQDSVVEMIDQQPKGNLIERAEEEQTSKEFGSATNIKISLCSLYDCLKKLDTMEHPCELILSHLKSLHSCPLNHKARKQQVHSALMK